MLWLCQCVHAQDASPSEYQVKAAFIYKFTRFIGWPAESFGEAAAPFVIGIIGENPFGAELDRAVQGKDVAGHPLVVREIKNLSDIKKCHVLFISKSERRRLAEILGAADNHPLLTISETDRFIGAGGMVNFLIEENKVRFEINDAPAKRAGLKISSKLLYLGRRAERAGGK